MRGCMRPAMIRSRIATVDSGPTPTLYVNAATGDDDRTKAQAANPATPWASPGRALWGSRNRGTPNATEAADAGDVVGIAAGDYTTNESVDSTQTPVFNPVNQGTSSAYLTVLAQGIVRLGAPAANAPLVGVNGRNYVKWYANRLLGHQFQLVCDGRGGSTPDTKSDPMVVNTRPDTGPVHFVGATGCEAHGFRIDAGPLIDYEDNWQGIRFEGCIGGVIRNNVIFGFHNVTDTGNGNGIKIYYSRDILAEHNTIYDCGGGFSIKDVGAAPVTVRDNIIRRNRIQSVTNSAFGYSIVDENGSQVYENLIIGANIGIFATGTNGNLVNEWIYNNTFVNCANLVYISTSGVWSGARFWNNIHYNGTANCVELSGQPMFAASALSLQHNVYQFSAGNFYAGSDGTRDFNNFKSAYTDQEVDDPDGLTTDPLFVNAGAGDYRLQGGSPARDLARHPQTNATMHAGCYQTGSEVIGVEG